MSLVPLLFSDWWEDLDRPHRIFDQDFGLALRPEQLLSPQVLDNLVLLPSRDRSNARHPLLYLRQRMNDLAKSSNTGTSTVKADKDKFQVILDVQQFKPEEINVKVVDKFVTVEAKHEEKQDEHGWISRQFVRKYMIPEQCDVEQVTSTLSSDGVLSITAPRKDVPKLENERSIKIEHTGKPAIQETPNETKKNEKTEKAVKK
ncbi:protein lethal(2)essential for life-like [Venturia canescens]|uniref:protein lethal(2)essential for life-like n=1 Tax=Venturia canescens TaxID=32260 RepID=UPI001C9CE248|nr:protein lethal(2)essential for life-like [Venturia canescens]